jgi:hypothetical protein
MPMNHKLLSLLRVGAFGAALASVPSYAVIAYDQNVTPGVIFGSGNANGSFTVDRSNGVELGLRGKLRHDATGQPQNVFNSNGSGAYSFAAGVAPTQSSPTAVWSYEWSINSNFDGTSGWNLDDLTYSLRLDMNPTQATAFFSFDPVNGLNPGTVGGYWDHSIGTNTTTYQNDSKAGDKPTYDGLIANNNVAQNSWKAHWYIPGFNPTVDGTYDIELAAYSGSTQVANSRIQIIVGAGGAAVPDSGATVALVGIAFAGLVGLRRRFVR